MLVAFSLTTPTWAGKRNRDQARAAVYHSNKRQHVSSSLANIINPSCVTCLNEITPGQENVECPEGHITHQQCLVRENVETPSVSETTTNLLRCGGTSSSSSSNGDNQCNHRFTNYEVRNLVSNSSETKGSDYIIPDEHGQSSDYLVGLPKDLAKLSLEYLNRYQLNLVSEIQTYAAAIAANKIVSKPVAYNCTLMGSSRGPSKCSFNNPHVNDGDYRFRHLIITSPALSDMPVVLSILRAPQFQSIERLELVFGDYRVQNDIIRTILGLPHLRELKLDEVDFPPAGVFKIAEVFLENPDAQLTSLEMDIRMSKLSVNRLLTALDSRTNPLLKRLSLGLVVWPMAKSTPDPFLQGRQGIFNADELAPIRRILREKLPNLVALDLTLLDSEPLYPGVLDTVNSLTNLKYFRQRTSKPDPYNILRQDQVATQLRAAYQQAKIEMEMEMIKDESASHFVGEDTP